MLNYFTYTATLVNLMVTNNLDANFNQILPSIIDYAEQRCYRELDLLDTVVVQTGSLTTNSRNFTLPTSPSGRFVVTNGINVFQADGTTRQVLTPVSRDALDRLWPSDIAISTTSLPREYAMITDQAILVGPPPATAATVEVYGTIRPTPISATNPSTYLSLYLPDLFVAASMIFASGYQKNFGSQADNPQMAQSWETQYGKLLQSANVEEMRKKYSSSAWASLQPTPIATPER